MQLPQETMEERILWNRARSVRSAQLQARRMLVQTPLPVVRIRCSMPRVMFAPSVPSSLSAASASSCWQCASRADQTIGVSCRCRILQSCRPSLLPGEATSQAQNLGGLVCTVDRKSGDPWHRRHQIKRTTDSELTIRS